MDAKSEFVVETSLINGIVVDTPSWSCQTLKEWDDNSFREKKPFASEKYGSGQHRRTILI